MAQTKHIGKIVISFEARQATPVLPSTKSCRADRTYLITGGLGGLGLSTARWMIEQGVRHVVLLGRRPPSESAAMEVEKLRGLGAEVVTASADVSNLESMTAVLEDITRTMPPLAGVIHSAGLLDDGLLGHLTKERFEKVCAPKVDGAWNLHLLTRDLPLDFFVLYSSGASLLGAPGQGNYASANAFLDALAHYRRAQGLPAMSINWGVWADVGLAAQANREERLAMRGFSSIEPAQGLEMLGRLLRHNPVQIGVLPLNLRQWRQSYPQLAETPLVARLMLELGNGAAVRQSSHIRAALMNAALSERLPLLEAHVQEQLALVVRLGTAQLERHTSFKSLGLDSLMALELRNCLEASLGLTLPVTMIWGYPTVSALAVHLLTRLNMPAEEAAQPRAAEALEETQALDRIAQLSDGEVERLFAARVSGRGASAP